MPWAMPPSFEQRRQKAEERAREVAMAKDPKQPRAPAPARKVRARKKKKAG
jgi:hypothetical protein